MIYNAQNKLIAACDYRAGTSNGFFELTSISHVGPALMSLALLRERTPSMDLSVYLNRLETCLRQVRELNRIPLGNQDHWLERLQENTAAWAPWIGDIRKMIDHACRIAIAYIESVTAAQNPVPLDKHTLQSALFEDGEATGGIGYNQVMVATFVLDALTGAYSAYEQALKKLTATDWQRARVILQTFAGENNEIFYKQDGTLDPKAKSDLGFGSTHYAFGNFTGGLDATSNWWVPLLKGVSGKREGDSGSEFNLGDDRIFIVPYANMLDTSKQVPASLTPFDWEYYSEVVWNGLYLRSQVANQVMGYIAFPEACKVVKQGFAPDGETIVENGLWPGDWGMDSVDDFMMRIKKSFGDVRQLLSNSVGFWAGAAFAAQGFKTEGMTIPGLTGVPYPEV
ncbi:DUF5624 domain-containing protein [Sulfidibacter corallicola]|uniref:DUF5624 domain-containing protein n=1 Tax=Sulfidibacter corallicola TaxID=2818388 RepID=UPI002351EDFB|nr:DUF5624 domain-containing protein [Sulfidibacter corallicola]